MSLFFIPTTTIEKIESIQKKILWTGTTEKNIFHLVSWDKNCNNKKAGGIAIKKIRTMNVALVSKMGWRLIKRKIFVKILLNLNS